MKNNQNIVGHLNHLSRRQQQITAHQCLWLKGQQSEKWRFSL